MCGVYLREGFPSVRGVLSVERHLSKSGDRTTPTHLLKQFIPEDIFNCNVDLTIFLMTLSLFSSRDVNLSLEISRMIYNAVIKKISTKRGKTKMRHSAN